MTYLYTKTYKNKKVQMEILMTNHVVNMFKLKNVYVRNWSIRLDLILINL